MLEDSTKVADSEKTSAIKEEQTVERYPWRSLNEITQFVTNHYKTRLNYERKKIEDALKKGVEFGFLRQEGDTFLFEEDDSDVEQERKQRKKTRRKVQPRESDEETETSGSDQCVECRHHCRLPTQVSSETESDEDHMCAAAVRKRRVTLRCPHCGSDSELDTLVRPFRMDRSKLCNHRSVRSFSSSSDESCDHQYNRSRSPSRKARTYNPRSKSCRVPRRRRKHRERSRSRERRLINMQRTRQKSPPRSGNRINSRSMPRRSLTYWPRSPSPSSKCKESSIPDEDRHSQDTLPKEPRPHSILRNKTFGIRPHPVLSEEIIRGNNDAI